jgi:hypothetical protein
MEERIISYNTVEQVPHILKNHLTKNFLFVRHNTGKKLLFFKKIPSQPQIQIED